MNDALTKALKKNMVNKNYLIINKKAQTFADMRIAGRAAVFLDEEGRALDYGVLKLDSSVYTMLLYRGAHMLMLVSDSFGLQNVYGIIWKDEEDFESGSAALGRAAGMRPSKQDLKISSYAWSIAEKLGDGVRIKVNDAVDSSDMAVCPECGMMNPMGSPYCLECGAELRYNC